MENTMEIKKENNVHAEVEESEITKEEVHKYILIALEEQRKE